MSVKRRSGLWAMIVLVLSGGVFVSARGQSTVKTVDGVSHAGKVTIEPGRWRIQAAGGEEFFVPLAATLEVDFGAGPSELGPAPNVASPTNASPTNGASTDVLSTNAAPKVPVAGWTLTQVGAGRAGTLLESAEGWQLTGGGVGMLGNSDAFCFAQQRLEASGQMVVRLDSMEGGDHVEAAAGIVLRDNVGESAAYAFLGIRKGTGLCFQYRQIASGMTMRTTNIALPTPVWLRLARAGGAVVADVSADGREWKSMARGNVNLGQSVRAGMVVAAGTPEGVVSARFRYPLVGARGIGYSPVSGYPRILLRGGSVVISPIESADASVVRLGGAFRGTLLSALNLARIEFAPVSPDLLERADADRRGVLLTDGDFLDGGLRGIATNAVTISSLLHGFRTFAAGSEAAILQTGGIEEEDAPYRISLRNGSELRAREITGLTNAMRADSPRLGTFTVRLEELRGLRRIRKP